MKAKNWILIMLTLTVLVITTAGITTTGNKISDYEIALTDTVITGQELFRLNCAGCHGLNKEGKPPTFPSLISIKEKSSKEQIHTQIKNGKGLMPSLAHLSDEAINAIIAYLFNEPDQKTAIKNYSSVSLGKNIVMSNCASCHRLAVNDPLPPNAKKMCPMMEPAALTGVTKRFTKEEFYNILLTGPCYMPSFDFLTAQDKNAIWTYLKTLEGKGEPATPTMGQTCPMMNGMNEMNEMENMEKQNKSVSDSTQQDTIIYTCSMHPEIQSNKPGTCPKCGMELVKKSKTSDMQKKKHKMKMMCPMMNGMNEMNMN